jgi:hypothetical protein
MELAESLVGLTHSPFHGLSSVFSKSWEHVHDHFIPNSRNNYHPHLFGHRAMGLFSVALICVKVFAIAAITFGPVVPVFSSAITSSNIISLTNQSRSEFNLSSLTENTALDEAAQTKANDMLARGYFSHNTPDGKTPWTFIEASGYSYLSAGENLAVNFTEAENVETAWMNSPGHKANILNKNFEEIGIGISQGEFEGHSAIFVVQMFGTPVAQKITLQSAPTKVQASGVPSPAPVVPTAPAKNATVAAASVESPAVPVTITSSQVTLGSSEIKITATISGPVVKVLGNFGNEAIQLSPQPNNEWSGVIPTAKLSGDQMHNVIVTAYDIKGKTVSSPVATFSGSTVANFSVVDSQKSGDAKTNVFGKFFNPKDFSDKLFILVIAGMLGCLAMAIGIKKHIQHVSLIANGSFVIMLACVLWMAG